MRTYFWISLFTSYRISKLAYRINVILIANKELKKKLHVPLAFKAGRPCSGVGGDIVLVFIFLCVGLMAIFCGVTFFSGF
jgi:hypothetical protein